MMTKADKFDDNFLFLSFIGSVICLAILIIALCAYVSNTDCPVDTATDAAYEVCSVTRYTDTKTNQFGDVLSTRVYYYFEYMDQDGRLHTEDKFQNTEYGLTKVQVGSKNEFVINHITKEKTLYLTKETLSKL